MEPLQIHPRGFSPNAPPRRTRADNHATVLVSWWCTGFALVIILLRVGGRFVRSERLFTEDKVMLSSIVPLLARMAVVHVILLYGTNNVQAIGLTTQMIHNRALGSKLVLASRILYALFIWTVKWSASQFLKRLTYATWSPVFERILRGIRIFLVVTFVGVVIGTLAECHPFQHFWQVVPDPGPNCRNGYSQLLTMGISDMITDVLLILFPIPIIFRSKMSVRRKISLSLLFMLSALLVVITAVRIVVIIDLDGLQQRRSLWASIEILAAAAVSNALVLGSFVRDRGSKKTRFRATDSEKTNAEGPSINRQMTLQHWGGDSDEDLFRSLGSRLDSAGEILPADISPVRPPPRVSDLMHPSTLNGKVPDSGPSQTNRPAIAQKEEDVQPQAYVAFLRDIDAHAPGLQRPDPRRRARAASIRAARSPNLVARHDFGAVDWSGPLQPEDLTLGDAGNLLPSPPTLTLSPPIVHQIPESAEVSPMSTRPRSGFPRLNRRAEQRHRSLDTVSMQSYSQQAVDDELQRRFLPSSNQGVSSGQARPEEMRISDPGGLLT